MRKPMYVSAAVLGGSLLLAAPADASQIVASWQMNEGAGARVMADSSGHGHSGSIGRSVGTGTATPGGRGYTFRQTTGDIRSRLVVVPDSAALDPGTGGYAVTVRLRTSSGSQNMVQKGQSGTAGGYFKVDMTRGQVHCLFRDGAGRTRAVGSSRALNDGRWHTLRCARTASGVSLTVDGSTRTISGSIGSVSNSSPVSVGGKLNCSSAGVGCDAFAGVMDFVRVEA